LEADDEGGQATLPAGCGQGQSDSTPARPTDANPLANKSPSDPQAATAATKSTAHPKQVDYRSLSQGVACEVNEAARRAAFAGRGSWLAPLEITDQALQQPVPGTRTSNLGCLNMTFTQYLQLLEWTGRQVAKGKVGKIPAEQPSILKQLGIEGEGWLKLVASFTDKRGALRRAIGRPAALEAEAAKRGQKWIQGIALSREIFANPTGDRPSDAN
jgi:hypothetical protein